MDMQGGMASAQGGQNPGNAMGSVPKLGGCPPQGAQGLPQGCVVPMAMGQPCGQGYQQVFLQQQAMQGQLQFGQPPGPQGMMAGGGGREQGHMGEQMMQPQGQHMGGPAMMHHLYHRQ